MSDWFLVNVGLRRGCEMSLLLFNVRIYGWCGVRCEYYGAWEMARTAVCEWWQV